MTDRQENLLQSRTEAAYAALAVAIRQAAEAVRARNLARKNYKRALGALVAYRERQPKQTQ